jgi:hypothetical protein
LPIGWVEPATADTLREIDAAFENLGRDRLDGAGCAMETTRALGGTPWESAGLFFLICQGPASDEVSVGPRSPTRAKGLFQGWPTITARMGLAPTGDLDGQHFFILRPNNEVHPAIPTHQVRRRKASSFVAHDRETMFRFNRKS